MKPNKLIGVVLLVLGGILIFFGINAADAPLEKLTETVTGEYTDSTMFYIIGGAISAVLGLVLTLRK